MVDDVEFILKHPFTKTQAEDFIAESCLDPWLKSVALSRVQDEAMPNDARALAKMLAEYIQLGYNAAKSREDAKGICNYCKLGFSLKSVLLSDDGLMQCGEECEYYVMGNQERV